MKAEVKTHWDEIVITLETEEEAQFLWHALNLSKREVERWEKASRVPVPKDATDMAQYLWERVDSLSGNFT